MIHFNKNRVKNINDNGTNHFTSSIEIGPITTYNCSIAMTHDAVLICLTGTCNLIFPINPDLISIGKPICRNASRFKGKFSNSTSPESKQIYMITYR